MQDETTVEKTAEEKELEIVKLAKDCLESHQDREGDNIRRAEEAIRFRAGEQWPDAIRRDREYDNQEGGSRPCPVLDKTDQYIRQIVNEERLNRAAIKIRPVDSGADSETADIFTGVIRHIEDQSEALVAYTSAGEQAVDGGFGYFRLYPEYESPMAFNQKICIKRIANRFSVATGYHTESDAADMQECLVWEDMRRSDFKREYPDAKEVGFEDSGDWADKDMIRVGEYFCIKPEPAKIHLFDDGRVLTDKDYKEAKAAAEAEGIEVPEPTDTRDTAINKVKWYKVTAEEVLDEKDLPGTWIPVIKVTGNEIVMPDGKSRLSGAIEAAMDAQRLHNYSIAGYIEHVALAPRAPWIAEESQVEGYESDYANANRKPIALLKYAATSDENGSPIPPPQRTPPAGMSTGWQQMLQNTEHGVEAAFGMYGASVGATGQEKSGIALQEQKSQGAIGQFQFPDNLARSIQHCGRILVEWIPVYYDAATVARILGEDGKQEQIKLDPNQPEAMVEEVDQFGQKTGQKIYNLTVGTYDVTVATGPSYTSKRQEAVDTQTQIIQAAPELMQIMGDILFSNMDSPGADKIAERLKIMLPPELRESEESKEVDPQTKQAMMQVEQAAAALEEKGQQLMQFEQEVKAAAQEADADKAEISAQIKDLDSQKKVFTADAKTMKANLELLGMKLIDQLEDVTEPLLQQLSAQKQEMETEDENGEPQTIVVQDPAMQEILQNIVMMTQSSTAQMAETVNNALISINESISQPKQTVLQYDEMGNPISSVSTPYGG